MSHETEGRADDPREDVSRREFLERVTLGIGAAVTPLVLEGCEPTAGEGARAAAQDAFGYYPPTLTGMRGSHPGSFEAGHALRDGAQPPAAIATGETYDLVVVGGGISGLSAALLYRDHVPDARVLVLDNHDDFGGHAKRNEFWLEGRMQLMNGGTYSIESPRPYSKVASDVLERIGIRTEEIVDKVQNREFYPSQGMVEAVFLDRETFGADFLVRHPKDTPWAPALAGSPFSERARRQIGALEDAPADYLPHLSPAAKKEYLDTISYRDFLLKHVGVEPVVAAFYQKRTHGLWGVGVEAVSALEGWATGLPGFGGMKLPPGSVPSMGETAAGFADTGGSLDVHLPDGGATVARGLVRRLVPAALPGDTLESLVTTHADYSKLDRGGAPTRIRLGATVTHVANLDGGGVAVEYQRAHRGFQVHARHAVLACWNMLIPYLCPELPEEQKAALHQLVKTPLIYANVAVRDWQAWKRLGVSWIHAPGGYFSDSNINECVAVGGYATPTDPSRPTLIRMQRTPCREGLPEHEQNKIGRAEILATSLEQYEREIRNQLDRMLGPGGFDSKRDILAITVNRWPHGYAPEINPLFDPQVPDAERPHVRGRARRGAITIANSDAASKAYMDAAIEQAHRAVSELFS